MTGPKIRRKITMRILGTVAHALSDQRRTCPIARAVAALQDTATDRPRVPDADGQDDHVGDRSDE
jgi:hypothetical protein